MLKRLLTSLVITALLVTSLGSPVDAVSSETLAEANLYITNNGDGLADKLQKTMASNEDSFTKRRMLEAFCSETLSHGAFTGEILDSKTVTYDPRQSMFMYMVCNTFIGNQKFGEMFTDTEKWYIKEDKHNLQGLNLICDERTGDDVDEVRQPVGCVPWCETSHMNDCDLSLLMPEVTRVLFNDLSNIGLGMAYGMIGISDPEIDNATLANRFGVRYFSTILCDKPGGTCLYPKTHKELTKDIKRARSLISNTIVVNTEPMEGQANKCTWPEVPEDLRWCTLASNNIVLAPVVDLMFNELYYYQLLMAYYKSFLGSSPYLGEFEIGTNVRQERLEKTSEEVERINIESTRTLKAVFIANRMLMQTQAYFPLHVALQTYNEAVVSFRNDLAKIYQPLHQLMFKLINVQKTND